MLNRYAIVTMGLVCLAGASVAQAQVNVNWGGRIQTDIRGRIVERQVGDWTAGGSLERGLTFNRNTFNLKVKRDVERVSFVTDLDFLWFGYSQDVARLGDVTRSDRLDYYTVRSRGIYLSIKDAFLTGLDLRIGQQVVNWGKGDQFNPTNNINANFFEDPLLFGEQLANSMVVADYAFNEDWTLSAVVVPVFRPAQLPLTASLAATDVKRLPLENEPLRNRIYNEQAVARERGFATMINPPNVVLPGLQFDNMQYALRLATTFANQDIALSYYYGRSDLPQPYRNDSKQVFAPRCNPNNPSECINGYIETTPQLRYSRMQVAGLNMAGELPLLAFLHNDATAVGYRFELGVFMPQQVRLQLFSDAINLGPDASVPAGEYDYAGMSNTAIGDKPYLKWVLGLDYSIGAHVYINAQWVHGFADEFGNGDFMSPRYVSVRGSAASTDLLDCYLTSQGASCSDEILRRRIGDYIVIGTDAKFLDDNLLLRVFVIYDITPLYHATWDNLSNQRVRERYSPFSSRGASAIVFPELTYNVGGGLELSLGGLLALGETYTKFGDPAVGGTQVWTRARFTY